MPNHNPLIVRTNVKQSVVVIARLGHLLHDPSCVRASFLGQRDQLLGVTVDYAGIDRKSTPHMRLFPFFGGLVAPRGLMIFRNLNLTLSGFVDKDPSQPVYSCYKSIYHIRAVSRHDVNMQHIWSCSPED